MQNDKTHHCKTTQDEEDTHTHLSRRSSRCFDYCNSLLYNISNKLLSLHAVCAAAGLVAGAHTSRYTTVAATALAPSLSAKPSSRLGCGAGWSSLNLPQ